MTSGGPTQTAISVTRACGSIPVRTVGQQGGRMGPPTCGTSTVTMGQTCMSVSAGGGHSHNYPPGRRLDQPSLLRLLHAGHQCQAFCMKTRYFSLAFSGSLTTPARTTALATISEVACSGGGTAWRFGGAMLGPAKNTAMASKPEGSWDLPCPQLAWPPSDSPHWEQTPIAPRPSAPPEAACLSGWPGYAARKGNPTRSLPAWGADRPPCESRPETAPSPPGER